MMPAAMLTAAVMLVFVTMVVRMIALNVGFLLQASVKQRRYCRIRISLHAAIQFDTRFCQCRLRTAADPSANQNIRAAFHQKTCQRAVPAAAGIHHFRADHLALGHLIDFKLLCMSEMLKDLSVFISNCNFHSHFSFKIVL